MGWIFGRKAYEPSGRLNQIMAQLREAGRPCVLLRPGDGSSKIGGLPDVALSSDWPQSESVPLSFLAQIDLPEVRIAGGPDWLPQEGTLLFFYDVRKSPWGFDPADQGGWAVLHEPVAHSKAGTSATESGGAAFAEVRLRAKASLSLPQPERLGLDLDGLADQELDAIYDAADEHFGDYPAHQVGGFASPIQGDTMELESQLVSNGIYCGDPSGYADPRAESLAAGAEDWQLLLQLDSDEAAEMMWGDGGRLLFLGERGRRPQIRLLECLVDPAVLLRKSYSQ